MPQNELRVRIKVDAQTGEITGLDKAFDSLKQSIDNVNNSISETNEFFKHLVTGVLSVEALSIAFDKVVANGFEFLSQLEQMKIGIASIIASNTEAAKGFDKWSLSMQAATEVLQELKEANRETVATLPELVEAFQAVLAPAMQAGFSLKQTVEYTKLMAQAAAAMGVPMNQLKQELTSIVRGTIDVNSVVATNIGLTNQQIELHKQQGDLFEFLKQKLEAFALAGTSLQTSMSGILSNLEDSWDDLTASIVQSSGAFTNVKKALLTLEKGISKLAENEQFVASAGEVVKTTFAGIAEAAVMVVKVIAGWVEIFATVKAGWTEIYDAIRIGLNNIVIKALEAKKSFLEFTDIFGQNKEAIEEINKKIADYASKNETLRKHIQDTDKSLKTFVKSANKVVSSVTKIGDTFVKELGKKAVKTVSKATKSMSQDWSKHLKFVKKKNTELTKEQIKQLQKLKEAEHKTLLQIQKDYLQTTNKKIELLNLWLKEHIEAVNKTVRSEKEKNQALYQLGVIYREKLKKLLQDEKRAYLDIYTDILSKYKAITDDQFAYQKKKLDKALIDGKLSYTDYYNKLQNLASDYYSSIIKQLDNEYTVKKTKLREWYEDKKQKILNLKTIDETTRAALLQDLKSSYYRQLEILEDEYTQKVETETTKRANVIKQAFLTSSGVFYQLKNGLQDLVSSWGTSYDQLVQKTNINVAKIDTIFNDSSTGLFSKIKSGISIVATDFVNTIGGWKEAAKQIGSAVEQNLEDTLFNVFSGKIRNLGDALKSFFGGVKTAILRMIAEIVAKKIVLSFLMAWDNPNWRGQGVIEKLLGIDVPFLTFSSGGYWTGEKAIFGKYGYVDGVAPYQGDTPKNDTVPALISAGEAVLPRSVVKQYRPLIDAMLGIRNSDTAFMQAAQLMLKQNVIPRFWGIGSLFHSIGHALSNLWKGAKHLLGEGWDWLKDKLGDAWDFVKDFGKEAWKVVKKIGKTIFKAVGRLFIELLKNPEYGWLAQLAIGLINPAAIPAMIEADLIATGVNVAQGDDLWEAFKNAGASGVFAGATSTLETLWATGQINSEGMGILEALQKTPDFIKNDLLAKWNNLKEAFSKLTPEDISKLNPSNFSSELWDKFKSGISSMMDKLANLPEQALHTIIDYAKHPDKLFINILHGVWEALKNHLKFLGNFIKDPALIGLFTSLTQHNLPFGIQPHQIKDDGTTAVVPAMANGGIITQPTLVLAGEAGKEAIIPLDRYEQITKANAIVERLQNVEMLLAEIAYFTKRHYYLDESREV